MRKRLAFMLVLVVGVVLASWGSVQAGSTTSFRASLNGDKEIGAGDSDGTGSFTARLSGTQICFTLRFSKLSRPVAAHIHRGRSTRNGAVVVDLQPQFTSTGARDKCVTAPRAVRSGLRNTPSNYYVNVHTQRYPEGAIRGQLTGS